LNRLMHILLVFYVTSRLEKSLCQYFCFKNTQNDCVSSVLKKRCNCSLRRIMDSISHKRICPPTPHTGDALATLSLPKIHTPWPPSSASNSTFILLFAFVGLIFFQASCHLPPRHDRSQLHQAQQVLRSTHPSPT
jgi:hypothetical protein